MKSFMQCMIMLVFLGIFFFGLALMESTGQDFWIGLACAAGSLFISVLLLARMHIIALAPYLSSSLQRNNACEECRAFQR